MDWHKERFEGTPAIEGYHRAVFVFHEPDRTLVGEYINPVECGVTAAGYTVAVTMIREDGVEEVHRRDFSLQHYSVAAGSTYKPKDA